MKWNGIKLLMTLCVVLGIFFRPRDDLFLYDLDGVRICCFLWGYVMNSTVMRRIIHGFQSFFAITVWWLKISSDISIYFSFFDLG